MLRIKSIDLKNFMSISDAHLEFDKKTTFLKGNNGFGKSSIFEAIYLCLSNEKRGDKIKDYIKTGSDFFEIKISADIFNDPLEVYYKVSDDKGNSKIMTFKDTEYKASECDSLIEELNLKFYSKLLFSRQNEELISEMSPTDRRWYLSRLLEFDFSEAREALGKEIDELTDKKESSESNIEFLKKSIDEQKDLIQTCKVLPYSLGTHEEMKQKVVEFDDSRMSALVENISDADKDIFKLESKKSDLLKEWDFYKRFEDKKSQLEFKIKETETEELNFDKEDARIKEIDESISQIDAALSDASKLSNIESETKILEKEKDLCKQGKCPTCGKPYEGASIEEIEKKLEDLSAAKTEFFANRDKLSRDKAELQKEKRDIQNKVSEEKNAKAIKDSENKQYKSQLDALLKESESLEKIDYESAIEDTDKCIEKSKSIKEKFQKELNALKEESAEIQELKRKILEFEKLQDDIKRIEENNKKIKELIEKKNEEIKSLQEDIVNFTKSIETKNEAYKVIQKDLPSYMTFKTCALIEKEMNDFIKSTMPLITLYFEPVKNGIDFKYAEYPETKKDAKNVKMASGFEKKLLSIAFKVALNKAYSLGFIILDEIDGDADEENSESMLNSIIEDKFFNQVFVISHKSSVVDSITSGTSDVKILTMPQKGVFVEDN